MSLGPESWGHGPTQSHDPLDSEATNAHVYQQVTRGKPYRGHNMPRVTSTQGGIHIGGTTNAGAGGKSQSGQTSPQANNSVGIMGGSIYVDVLTGTDSTVLYVLPSEGQEADLALFRMDCKCVCQAHVYTSNDAKLRANSKSTWRYHATITLARHKLVLVNNSTVRPCEDW